MIYLITGAGEPNFGDELIALGWVTYYRQKGYNGPIFVDCKSSVGARKLHGKIENVQFGRYLKAITLGRDGDVADYIAAGRQFVDVELGYTFNKLLSIVDSARNRLRSDDIPSDLRSTKLIHLVGGGYINGTWPNSFSLIGAASQLGIRLNCPVVATGLGVAPISRLSINESSALTESLADFRMFELRDRKSYDELVDLGVSPGQLVLGYDDCFLHPVKIATKFRGRSLHLSLFSKHLEGSAGQEILDSISDGIDEFDRILCWQCNPTDKAACELIEKYFPSKSVKRLFNNRMLRSGLPFLPDDFMITSRFHPHIMAARTGVTGHFLAFSDFYDAKHESVLALGSSFRPLNERTKIDLSYTSGLGITAEREEKYLKTKREVANSIYGFI